MLMEAMDTPCGQAMSHFLTPEGKLGVLRVFYYVSAVFLYLQAFLLSRMKVRPNLDAGKRFSRWSASRHA